MYFDSALATQNSDGSFTESFTGGLVIRQNDVAYIDTCTFSNVIDTVSEHSNKLYLQTTRSLGLNFAQTWDYEESTLPGVYFKNAEGSYTTAYAGAAGNADWELLGDENDYVVKEASGAVQHSKFTRAYLTLQP